MNSKDINKYENPTKYENLYLNSKSTNINVDRLNTNQQSNQNNPYLHKPFVQSSNFFTHRSDNLKLNTCNRGKENNYEFVTAKADSRHNDVNNKNLNLQTQYLRMREDNFITRKREENDVVSNSNNFTENDKGYITTQKAIKSYKTARFQKYTNQPISNANTNTNTPITSQNFNNSYINLNNMKEYNNYKGCNNNNFHEIKNNIHLSKDLQTIPHQNKHSKEFINSNLNKTREINENKQNNVNSIKGRVLNIKGMQNQFARISINTQYDETKGVLQTNKLSNCVHKLNNKIGDNTIRDTVVKCVNSKFKGEMKNLSSGVNRNNKFLGEKVDDPNNEYNNSYYQNNVFVSIDNCSNKEREAAICYYNVSKDTLVERNNIDMNNCLKRNNKVDDNIQLTSNNNNNNIELKIRKNTNSNNNDNNIQANNKQSTKISPYVHLNLKNNLPCSSSNQITAIINDIHNNIPLNISTKFLEHETIIPQATLRTLNFNSTRTQNSNSIQHKIKSNQIKPQTFSKHLKNKETNSNIIPRETYNEKVLNSTRLDATIFNKSNNNTISSSNNYWKKEKIKKSDIDKLKQNLNTKPKHTFSFSINANNKHVDIIDFKQRLLDMQKRICTNFEKRKSTLQNIFKFKLLQEKKINDINSNKQNNSSISKLPKKLRLSNLSTHKGHFKHNSLPQFCSHLNNKLSPDNFSHPSNHSSSSKVKEALSPLHISNLSNKSSKHSSSLSNTSIKIDSNTKQSVKNYNSAEVFFQSSYKKSKHTTTKSQPTFNKEELHYLSTIYDKPMSFRDFNNKHYKFSQADFEILNEDNLIMSSDLIEFKLLKTQRKVWFMKGVLDCIYPKVMKNRTELVKTGLFVK